MLLSHKIAKCYYIVIRLPVCFAKGLVSRVSFFLSRGIDTLVRDSNSLRDRYFLS